MKNYSNQVQLHERVMENGDHFKNGASPKSLMSRKKIKLFALLAFILLFGVKAMAQDVIVLKSGDEIKSLVQEVGTEYVKYKKFDNQSGPVYNVAISQIFMIKYENGAKDLFNEPAKQEEPVIPAQVEEKEEVQNQLASLSVQAKSFHRNVVYNSDGVKLSNDEVRDMMRNVPEALDIYDSGQTLKSVGWVCWGVGVGCLIGFLTQRIPVDANGHFQNYSFLYWAGGELVSISVANICWNVGSKKIAKSVDRYNNSIQSKHHSSDLSLNFGVTRSGGIGFTLDF